ncbi:hypothetical protein D920_01590 [Enterococcus faecalis 13-SD-W-01]|nr:hypothetical protein D920_01590 [Enterococcus faecalis 13-SD-W-01]
MFTKLPLGIKLLSEKMWKAIFSDKRVLMLGPERFAHNLLYLTLFFPFVILTLALAHKEVKAVII